jgi:hypothetical protein
MIKIFKRKMILALLIIFLAIYSQQKKVMTFIYTYNNKLLTTSLMFQDSLNLRDLALDSTIINF